MRERRSVSRALVARPESLGRPRRSREDDINMDREEVRWGGMDWIALAQDRGR
jgi:hypothetical protein